MAPVGALRAGLAAAAGLVLVGTLAWGRWRPAVQGPARVEAARAFRVTHAGDGRVRWSILDGEEPGGPVLLEDGLLQGERGDPVRVARDPAATAAATVDAGAPVARVNAPGLQAEAEALRAELALVQAEEALLRAGGRPETVARAARAVQVAEASLAQARAEADHVQGLATRGAGAAWEVAQAEHAVALRRAERALAQAEREEARLAARPEELAQVAARAQALQARLAAAEARVAGQELRAPFAGRVDLPGGDVIVEVVALGPPVVQVAVDEAAAGRIAVGDPLVFEPTAAGAGSVPGHVTAVGGAAVALGGRPVVWIVGTLDGPAPVGATGQAHLRPGAAP